MKFEEQNNLLVQNQNGGAAVFSVWDRQGAVLINYLTACKNTIITIKIC